MKEQTMNIKPSGQQVEKWIAEASSEGGKILDPNKLAELAAKWGASQAQQTTTFQSRVLPWLLECFGHEIASDARERNHRFLEESLELVQACGCTQSEAHQLVDYVYGRDVGEKHQEVGGVMVTLASLCLAQHLDMHNCGEVELARIWTKVDQIRAKQAAKPKHSPLPQHVPQSQPSTAEEPELPEAVAYLHKVKYLNGGAGVVLTYSSDHPYADDDRPEYSGAAVTTTTLHTATQMHDHFAAGVRAGMGQSQWQPIETAPKDGRSFDVWVKSTKNPDYGVRMTGVYYVQGVLCGSKFPNSSWCEYASHWMPLPEPPAMQGGQK